MGVSNSVSLRNLLFLQGFKLKNREYESNSLCNQIKKQMNLQKSLSASLSQLQENVIGIAKIHGNIEMVIGESEHTFTTVWIGNLGGLSESHYPKSQFEFENFPIDYTNLSEFLKQPVQFHNWYNEQFK